MDYKYINDKHNKIPLYPQEDIEKIRAAGLIAYNTLEHIKSFIKEGVSTEYLNKICQEFIESHNGIAAPLNYHGFPKATCISVNHVICHGIPSENKILQNGDILNIDITVLLNGFYGDTSAMFYVGEPSIKAKRLVEVTKECLNKAIAIVKPGCYLGDIGYIIAEHAHNNGFSVVEEFCGHGIGHIFHQDPQVLHFGKKGTGIMLQEGMVITIEPMINAGKRDIKILQDGWTTVTKDKSLSAQWEHTLAVTKDGYDILTLPKINNDRS